MNMRLKWEESLEAIKKNDEHFAQVLKEKIEKGEETVEDFYNCFFYSGLHNGFKFVWLMLDGQTSEQDFDEHLKKILQVTQND